jgi:hypothetical protein
MTTFLKQVSKITPGAEGLKIAICISFFYDKLDNISEGRNFSLQFIFCTTSVIDAKKKKSKGKKPLERTKHRWDRNFKNGSYKNNEDVN